jgi:hypothetical protein
LIKDLRSRLKAAGITEEVIETIHGLGYRLKAAPTVEKSAEVQRSKGEKDTQTHETVLVSVDAVEERFRLSLEQRIRVLEEMEVALQTDQLSPEQQENAREEAHKLVGGLGTFGYPKGSKVNNLTLNDQSLN